MIGGEGIDSCCMLSIEHLDPVLIIDFLGIITSVIGILDFDFNPKFPQL